MNNSETSPVFIVGTPRSGTTLTAKILGLYSHIFMPGETHFMDDIYSLRNQLGDIQLLETRQAIAERLYTLYQRYNEPEDQLRVNNIFKDSSGIFKAIKHCESYSEILNEFMLAQMPVDGKTRWGNNVPRDVFNIRHLQKMYPNAKFIVCVRDVRAFLLSYQNKWKISAQAQRLKKLYHPVITSLLWKSSMRQIAAAKKIVAAGNLFILKYEDLVAAPQQKVMQLCRFLAEDFQPAMLAIQSNNSSEKIQERGIFNKTVDAWKTKLSAEEIFLAQLINGKLMHEHHYSKIKPSLNWLKVLFIILQTPFALFRALHANKQNRGPLLPYLKKRLSSIF